MRFVAVIGFLMFVSIAPSAAQQGAAPGSAVRDLASGWNALAFGRTAEAEAVADKLLQAGLRRHEALSLKILARMQSGRPDTALDAYEEFLKAAPHEDVFLLQPIAAGILETQAVAADADLRVEALQALAEAGDKQAPSRLLKEAASAEAGGIADEALVGILNPDAIGRLSRRVAAPGSRADTSSAIEALLEAKPAGAANTIAAALDPDRPMPTKMAAARALGLLGGVEAVPRLRRALQDPEPPVRMMAAVSLVRLGDQSGSELVRQMENSPVSDIRLMAAEASAPGNPSGAWVAVATGALGDPDPLARLSAARLLIAHASDPTAALQALNSALWDPNPALRLAAVRVAADVPREVMARDVVSLRRLLRDKEPRVRILAAAALLKLAGGVE